MKFNQFGAIEKKHIPLPLTCKGMPKFMPNANGKCLHGEKTCRSCIKLYRVGVRNEAKQSGRTKSGTQKRTQEK